MAIEKKLIHFKKWSDFSSKKLSANEQNTQYTSGVDGALTTGAPDVLYQSICWIKDVKKMWTHGTLYDCSGGGGVIVETDPVFSASPAATITAGKMSAWDGKQDAITDIDVIRRNAVKGATAVQPGDVAGIVTEEGFVTADDLAGVASSGNYNDLVDKPTFKTINGESVVGSGDITINGGSGEQGPQGDKGDKGDKGDTGVGVRSVAQTTTSNADGGSNVVTVTLTDGTKSTFTVKNGSKGSQGEKGDTGETGPQGIQGEQGPKGDKGDTGANGTNGTNGVSVSSVKQTTTSTADGGTNVVTVTLSNGTTSTFNVKNGSKGSSGSNGTNGKDGADGATFTPSVDSAGNLSWTNNKGLTNPPTVNVKGPKGDAGEGGGSGGPTIVEVFGLNQSIGLEDNTIYKAGSVAELEVYPLEQLDIGSVVRFRAIGDCTITISDVYWANGVTPTIESDVVYELSLASDENSELLAVLTPFKAL